MRNLKYAILLGALFGALIMLLVQPTPGEAGGHIDESNVVTYLRTPDPHAYELWFVDIASNNTNDMTPGLNGVLAAMAFAPAASAVTFEMGHTAASSTIAAPPYPCRVLVYPKNDDTTRTLACTGPTTIGGYDQFGRPQTDRMTTALAQGSAVKTDWAYEKVTYIKAEGCTGGGIYDAGDKVMVACAPDIGLPMPIEHASAIHSVCAFDESAGGGGTDTGLRCWPGASIDDPEDLDLQQDVISFRGATINTTGIGEDDAVGGAALDLTFTDGDLIFIRIRPPKGR